jgi:3-hydroxybutyryl-CoA dehydrogenase
MNQTHDAGWAVRRRPGSVEALTLAVLGGGLMGHSIAGVFARHGATVRLFEPVAVVRDSVTARVAEQLTRQGLDTAAADAIEVHAELEAAVSGADLVIEAVTENLELKQSLFQQVGGLLPDAVLATNSSVLRTSDIAAHTANPARVLGTHWFNPPHLVPIVEVIQGEQTAFEYVAWVMELLQQAGKMPVHVRKDVPGFIGNRLQHALWREAIHLVATGVCDAETVDLVARNSFGLRLSTIGPIENADYVGLDLTLAVHENVFPSLCRDQEPSELLVEHVAKGELGAKSGKGFTEWPAGRHEAVTERLDAFLLRSLAQAKQNT